MCKVINFLLFFQQPFQFFSSGVIFFCQYQRDCIHHKLCNLIRMEVHFVAEDQNYACLIQSFDKILSFLIRMCHSHAPAHLQEFRLRDKLMTIRLQRSL
eukprot:Gb_23238 [translate_table: standard]